MPFSSALSSNQELLSLIVSAIQGDAQSSLLELFELLQLPQGEPALWKVQEAMKFTRHCGLEMVPGLDKGDLGTTRRFQLIIPNRTTSEKLRQEVENGEGPRLEFKSSLLYDHQKAANCPGISPVDLRSDKVLHSCLKTVAAFLNSGGGILYIGVDDHGQTIGIAEDLLFLKEEKRNLDNWELMFRDLLKANFKDGDNVNDYVRLEFVDSGGVPIPRIEVYPRKQLSFLKRKESCALYRRQGNRTAEVMIDQIEEFLALRTT